MSENTVVDIDGEVVDRETSFNEFKLFVLNMNVAAYEESVLRFGLSKSEAKSLCIPAKLGKEFGFKCYQPKSEELVTEGEVEEVTEDA